MRLIAIKDVGEILQKMFPPLVVLSLTDLMLHADVRHRPAFEPLNDDVGLGLGGSPLPLVNNHLFPSLLFPSLPSH